MSLAARVTLLQSRIASEFQDYSTAICAQDTLSLAALETVDKGSLVGAINELHSNLDDTNGLIRWQITDTGSIATGDSVMIGDTDVATETLDVVGTVRVRTLPMAPTARPAVVELDGTGRLGLAAKVTASVDSDKLGGKDAADYYSDTNPQPETDPVWLSEKESFFPLAATSSNTYNLPTYTGSADDLSTGAVFFNADQGATDGPSGARSGVMVTLAFNSNVSRQEYTENGVTGDRDKTYTRSKRSGVYTSWVFNYSTAFPQPDQAETDPVWTAAKTSATSIGGDWQFSNRLRAPQLGLDKSDVATLSRFGASVGSTTADWNSVEYTRPGAAPALLFGGAPNGPGGQFYHVFTLEYQTKNGTGALSQMAYPYGNGGASDRKIWHRNRFGSWLPWEQFYTSLNPQPNSKAGVWGEEAGGILYSKEGGATSIANAGAYFAGLGFTSNSLLVMKNSAGATTLRLDTNGSSYFNGGNVGIGTTSPSEKLHVKGNGYFTNNVGIGVAPTSTSKLNIGGAFGGISISRQSGEAYITLARDALLGGRINSFENGGLSFSNSSAVNVWMSISNTGKTTISDLADVGSAFLEATPVGLIQRAVNQPYTSVNPQPHSNIDDVLGAGSTTDKAITVGDAVVASLNLTELNESNDILHLDGSGNVTASGLTVADIKAMGTVIIEEITLDSVLVYDVPADAGDYGIRVWVGTNSPTGEDAYQIYDRYVAIN